MYDFIYNSILSVSYPGIFLLMMIFPSETVMILVGYIAAHGHLSLLGAIVAGTVGSTFGSVLVYAVARMAKHQTVYRLIDKYGRWLGISSKNVKRAGAWFSRYERSTVFFGRFIPGIRTAVSVPAGFERMPFLRFVLYTAAGSGVGSTALALLGYSAKDHLHELVGTLSNVSTFITVGLLVIIVGYILRQRYTRSV